MVKNDVVGFGENTLTTPVTFTAQTTFATGSQPSAVSVGDFNNDGKTDLAVTNFDISNNTVSVLLRNAANTGFDPKVDYATGYNPIAISTGDFNNDGKLDLAVANSGDTNVSVLLRNSTNTGFDTKVDYATGYSPYSISAGDFNNDGKTDFAVDNRNSSVVSVFLRNTANTGFDTRIDYAVGTTPLSVKSGDFNNDGRLDLVVANNSDNTVSVLLRNTSNTGFDTKVDYATGTNPNSICVGDFNNDGKTDLAVTNRSSNTISVLLRNDANTGFDTKIDYATGLSPKSISTGDFNNDGKLDLAVANFDSNTISVLLRNADNTGFDTKVDYATGIQPSSVSVGDFNNNGKNDLVTTNQSDNTISVLLNTTNFAPSFTVSGKVITRFDDNPIPSLREAGATSIALQSDGKIVVAGYSHPDFYSIFTIVRYNENGSLDASFNGNGIATTAVGLYGGETKAVAIQTDGKIVAAGIFNNGDWDSTLVRYNTDGSLDTSFDSDGIVLSASNPGVDTWNSIAIQGDGKILVAGYKNNGTDADFALARYNSNGSLDSSFDNDGIVTTDFGSYEEANSVAMQSDGKILVAGDTHLVRYNSNGSLDTSFAGDGTVENGLNFVSTVKVQADGKILVVGETFGNLDFSLTRYNNDGSLDTSFGGDGLVTTDITAGASESAQSVAIQSDGKILVAGTTGGGTYASLVLVRYNNDGSLDASFGDGGKTSTVISNGGVNNVSVAIQTDGKIVLSATSHNLSGSSVSDIALVRYNSDGSLDKSFNPINTLDGVANYTENGTPVILDDTVQIYDAELAAQGNYNGASITLKRQGTANPDDVFSSAFFSAQNVVVSGTTIGTFTQSNGTLIVTFNANATQALVDQTLSSFAYSNTSNAPPTSIQIDWIFNDGDASGALTALGSTTVNITNQASNNIPPTVIPMTSGLFEDSVAELSLLGADTDGAVTGFKISNLPAGILYSDPNLTTAVTVNSLIPVTTSNALNLYFKPNANWNGTTSFDYVGVDNNGAESASATMTLNVAPVPDAPTFSSRYLNNVVITQGTETTPESAVVTFAPLNKGDLFTFNGVTVYAMNNETSANVAAVFANRSVSTNFNNEIFGNLILNGTMEFGYETGAVTDSNVTFTNSVNGDFPDWELTLANTGMTFAEAPTFTSTGDFTINDVDFADVQGDTVSVDVLGVNITSSPDSVNATVLASLFNTATAHDQAFDFLTLSNGSNINVPNLSITNADTVEWSFDVANIPNFESLLTGESINFSYHIEATDSDNVVSEQALNFIIQGETKIISATVIPASADLPDTIQIETENGTDIKLFEDTTDVTDKFNQDFSVDSAGIKTIAFTVKPNSGYIGNKSLVAKSYLISDPTTVQDTWSGTLNLTVPDGDDNLMGTDGNDTLFGGLGNDTLSGLLGNDSLDGGEGNDSLEGGEGFDTLIGGAGSDTLSGGIGNDVYFISDATDTVIELEGEGIDTVHSTVTYTLSDYVEDLYLDGTAAIGGTGNADSNNIHGNDAANTLDDGDANGSSTPNNLSGGKGNDIYVVHSTGTSVVETNVGGIDTVQSYLTGFFQLPRNIENLELFGEEFNFGRGNNLANSITGSAGSDTLDGGAGADTLAGGTGNDTYIIDRVTDQVIENASEGTDVVQSIVTYTLPANVETLTLTGLAAISGTGNELDNSITGNDASNTLSGLDGADMLDGGNGRDTLDGGSGADTIIGGIGVDSLTGGEGADTFQFSLGDTGKGILRDVITDFVSGTDKIDLSAMNIVGSAGTGALADMFTIRWTFYGSYAVVQGDTNEDPATVDFEIKLNGVTALADTDFIFAPILVTGTGSSDASVGNVRLQFAEGTYDYSISNFGAGDTLIFPNYQNPTLTNTNSTDGDVTVEWASAGSVMTVTLTGLTNAQDSAIFDIPSFNSVFGAGSII
ncbi:MAG: FG-GAP-like repeat-containing protein [Methylococcales bacterium]|nr:FG-GAP-like repeat-containing protein [Methylococcales bacterium]